MHRSDVNVHLLSGRELKVPLYVKTVEDLQTEVARVLDTGRHNIRLVSDGCVVHTGDLEGAGEFAAAVVRPPLALVQVGEEDGPLEVWDLVQNRRVAAWPDMKEYLFCVTCDGEAGIAACGFELGALKLFDLSAGCLDACQAHNSPVTSLCLAWQLKRLVSGSEMCAKVWDIATLELRCTHCLDGHAGSITSLNTRSTTILTAGRDGCLGVWDVGLEPPCRSILSGHARAINAVRMSADASAAVTASDDGTLRLWDLNTLLCVQELLAPGEKPRFQHLAVSFAHGRAVSLDRYRGQLHLWDLQTPRYVGIVAMLPELCLCRFLDADFDAQRVLMGTGFDEACVLTLDLTSGAVLSKTAVMPQNKDEDVHHDSKLFHIAGWRGM
mmetsp:Transcript_52734/g.123336  ORF Transcript_52734/g.123336 Transcript_52734/m.123336 type:complete len:383 (-) Transcript_52734:66-1214(-)